MSGREEKYLEQIAKELHQMNKVLERIAQASIFNKMEKPTTEETNNPLQELHSL